jgi:hypothetical protein
MGTSSRIRVNSKRLYNKAFRAVSDPDDFTLLDKFRNEVIDHQKKQGILPSYAGDVINRLIESLDKIQIDKSYPFEPEQIAAKKICEYAVANAPFGVAGSVLTRAAYATASKMVLYRRVPRTPIEAIMNARSYFEEKGSESLAKEFAKNLALSIIKVSIESSDEKPQIETLLTQIDELEIQAKIRRKRRVR